MMLCSLWSGTQNLPGIQQVGQAFCELAANGILLRYTVASLFRVTVGFYLAAVTAIPLGIFLGRRRIIYQWINPVLQFLRPISPLAWIPFAMLWFGIGDQPALFIIFLASFFPLLVSTIKASATIHPMYFQVAANLQFNVWESIYYVLLPATIPNIILALRVTLGIAWMVVVAAEMIAVKSGLGFLILDGRNALRMDYVIVAMITIGIIGVSIDWAMTKLESVRSVRWRLAQG